MFQVLLTRRAKKDYDALPSREQKRIFEALHGLEEDPYLGKKFEGDLKGHWSLRVWPYRIIYVVEKKIVTVTVVTIGQRKDVYRKLR
jgi:mRNA interferase RelE/StbE